MNLNDSCICPPNVYGQHCEFNEGLPCDKFLLQFTDPNYLYVSRCGIVEKSEYGNINAESITKADDQYPMDLDQIPPIVGFQVWFPHFQYCTAAFCNILDFTQPSQFLTLIKTLLSLISKKVKVQRLIFSSQRLKIELGACKKVSI